MKQFDQDAQFLGKALFPAIMSLHSSTRNNMLRILADLGITDPNPEKWYDNKIILEFYYRLAKEYGPNTIFQIGKAIPHNAKFPPGINTIEDGFKLIDTAFKMNKQGYVGFYKMVEHDKENKKIVMQCHHPYPCDVDRGLFISMARKFKTGVRVELDTTKPHKKQGGNESWYIITYR
jgi:hypothetical protein